MRKVTVSTCEFFSRFPDETAAREYYESRRWPIGPVCPLCGSGNNSPRKGRIGFYHCNDCRRSFSAKSGTIMERSKIEIRTWLYAMYLLSTARKGISSLRLSKEIGVTQKTAWFMLHRIREARISKDGLLHGKVEIDETCIGGKEKNRHAGKKQRPGRGPAGKAGILGMKEREGRVRAMPMEGAADGISLKCAVAENVKRGGQAFTDRHKGCSNLKGYEHEAVNHGAGEYVRGGAHTNTIESVWAVMKRGCQGVCHHWSRKHPHRCINEFTFRLNDGNAKRHIYRRIDSLCGNLSARRMTCPELIAK